MIGTATVDIDKAQADSEREDKHQKKHEQFKEKLTESATGGREGEMHHRVNLSDNRERCGERGSDWGKVEKMGKALAVWRNSDSTQLAFKAKTGIGVDGFHPKVQINVR